MSEKSDYIRLMQQSEETLISLAKELNILAPTNSAGKLSIPKGTLVSLLLGECPGCNKNVPTSKFKNVGATPNEPVVNIDRFSNRVVPIRYNIKDATNKIFCNDAIVISLKRSKESRLDPFLQANKFNGNLVVLEATDGADFDAVPEGWAKLGGIGTYACLISHIRAIEFAKENQFPCALILEDDVRFEDGFNESLRSIMSYLPDDWDALWLAGSDHVPPLHYNDGVKKIVSTWGAYAYILRDTVYDKFLQVMGDKRLACDDYYRREQVNINAFKAVNTIVKHVGKLSDRLATNRMLAKKKVDYQYVLYINWHESKDALRKQEFATCLENNLKVFDRVVNLSDTPVDGTEFVPFEGRPTYNDFFALMKEGEVSVLANLDIYFDETLKLKTPTAKQCFALTRWNINEKDEIAFFNRADSQDAWIFTNPPKQIKEADFTMGIAGCDNKIAYLMDAQGYDVTNPSVTIKSYHLHNTTYRTYIENGKVVHRLPPPYKPIMPTE